jgi:hypothetical protein
MWVTTSELACSELFVDTIGLFFIVAIDSVTPCSGYLERIKVIDQKD